MEILQFLILPFLASLILTGIHAYLGVHVVERGVIFVDLAWLKLPLWRYHGDPDRHGSPWHKRLLDEPGIHFVGAGIFTFVRSRQKAAYAGKPYLAYLYR